MDRGIVHIKRLRACVSSLWLQKTLTVRAAVDLHPQPDSPFCTPLQRNKAQVSGHDGVLQLVTHHSLRVPVTCKYLPDKRREPSDPNATSCYCFTVWAHQSDDASTRPARGTTILRSNLLRFISCVQFFSNFFFIYHLIIYRVSDESNNAELHSRTLRRINYLW